MSLSRQLASTTMGQYCSTTGFARNSLRRFRNACATMLSGWVKDPIQCFRRRACHCSHQCCWAADVLHERYPGAVRAQLLQLESVKRMLVPNAVGQSTLLCDHLTCFADSFKVPSCGDGCVPMSTRPPISSLPLLLTREETSIFIHGLVGEWLLCWNAVTTICSN